MKRSMIIACVALCVAISAAGITYDEWAQNWGIPLGGMEDDIDGDGLKNLGEFALGSDPTIDDTGGLITYSVVSGTNLINYTHGHWTNAASLGLEYQPQITDNPASGVWTNCEYVTLGTTNLWDDFEIVTNRLDYPVYSNNYFRLAISLSNVTVYSEVIGLTELPPPPVSVDFDEDGIADSWELEYFTNLTVAGHFSDNDGDFTSDFWEYTFGGDPTNSSDIGMIPYCRVIEENDTNWFECVHAERINHVAGYTNFVPLTTPDLVLASWDTQTDAVIGTAILDSELIVITNRFAMDSSDSLFVTFELNLDGMNLLIPHLVGAIRQPIPVGHDFFSYPLISQTGNRRIGSIHGNAMNGDRFATSLTGGYPAWVSSYSNQVWNPSSLDIPARPKGYAYSSGTAYTNYICGIVLGEEAHTNTLAAGTNIVANPYPTSISLEELLVDPSPGDRAFLWDSTTQAFTSEHTYYSPGLWSPALPVMNISPGHSLVYESADTKDWVYYRPFPDSYGFFIPPALDLYALAIVNGTGGGSYESGAEVQVTADAPQPGHAFAGWTTDPVEYTNNLADATSSNTTFTMPSTNVTLTANFIQASFMLTVELGSGGGSYTNGESVSVVANAPPEGQTFSHWTANSAEYTNNLADASASSTTFTMPPTNVTLTANYAVVPHYTLTVEDGSGDGSYTNGEPVSVVANAPPGGQAFSLWTANPAHYTNNLANVSASSTAFTMPSTNVTLTANYLPVYVITTTAGANGSISPIHPVVVQGEDQTFTIQADPEYQIDSLTIDGVSTSVVSSFTFYNVQTTHAIAATFAALPTYTVTTTAGSNGSITPENPSVVHGTDQAFSIQADPGYQIDSLTIDGVPTSVVSSFTFYNVQAMHAIAATFAATPSFTLESEGFETGFLGDYWTQVPPFPETWTVTGAFTPPFFINPYEESFCAASLGGGDLSITLDCEYGYIGFWYKTDAGSQGFSFLIDGVDQGDLDNLFGSSSLEWTFALFFVDTGLRTFTWSTAGIAPGNVVFLDDIYFPSPDDTPPDPDPMSWETEPYAISEDTIQMVATTAYDDHYVEYYFEETSGNPGGEDSGWKENPIYTNTGLNANTEYSYRVKARDMAIAQNETGYSPIRTATTHQAYLITTDAGANGTISPVNPIVEQGQNQSFSIQPGSGYAIDSLTVDGESQAISSNYTFHNVQSAHTISATFKENTGGGGPYWISASAGLGGSITPTGVWIPEGEDQTFFIDHAPGYYISSLRVDGTSVVADYIFTLYDVQSGHTISVQFELLPHFTITTFAGPNGSITPENPQVLQGGDASFEIRPDSGYQILSVTKDGLQVPPIPPFTFPNVQEEHTISATFAKPPTVSNADGATSITESSATLRGEIIDTGDDEPTVSIYWGDVDGGTNKASWETGTQYGCVYIGLKSGVFSGGVDSLEPNKTYYYRCFATNAVGFNWADSTEDLTTLPVDIDGDGLPNWWEREHYGGNTAADTNAICANGINTVMEAYIAGLVPTDPYAGFLSSIQSGSTSLEWDPTVSGRVYSVWWTSNLLSGFQCIDSNIPWTDTPYTDTVHGVKNQGFYKIDVEME